jgi:hypothetical protein
VKQGLKVLCHVIRRLGPERSFQTLAHSVQRKVGTPAVGTIGEIALPIEGADARKT